MSVCENDCGECRFCQTSTELFEVKYLYSFEEDGVLYEGVENRLMTPRMLATCFKDHHLVLIEVNGILYGRNYDGSWANCYLGEIEMYLSGKGIPYDHLAQFNGEIPF